MRVIYLILFLSVIFAGQATAKNLHAIVVADTNDANGGRSFQVDFERISKLVNEVARHTNLKLHFHGITGNRLNSTTLKNTVLKVKESLNSRNDVVLFYYSGHGGRYTGKDKVLPMMDIKDGAVDLSWVRSELNKNNPRLMIIVADTCNNFDERLNPVWSRRAAPVQGELLSRTQAYKRLFLDLEGHVFATSAKPGQHAWGNAQHGGFFTDAWLRNLERELYNSSPNWYTIMKRSEAAIIVGNIEQNPLINVAINAKNNAEQPSRDNCYYYYKPNGVLCCRSPSGTTCEEQDDACPRGGLFMKPGGIVCCRRPSGVTCE
jgi:hypothetical protein